MKCFQNISSITLSAATLLWGRVGKSSVIINTIFVIKICVMQILNGCYQKQQDKILADSPNASLSI